MKLWEPPGFQELVTLTLRRIEQRLHANALFTDGNLLRTINARRAPTWEGTDFTIARTRSTISTLSLKPDTRPGDKPGPFPIAARTLRG